MQISFKKEFAAITPIIPSKKTSGSIGYDLHAVHAFVLSPSIGVAVHTGLIFNFPQNVYATIHTKSRLAAQNVQVVGGIIDSDYRGELIVMLLNMNVQKTLRFKAGDMVAQMILHKAEPDLDFEFELVKTFEQDDFKGKNERNDSSGIENVLRIK